MNILLTKHENGLSGKKINWANKSHEYKGKINDWLRLCTFCHKKYDKQAHEAVMLRW